MCEKGILGLKPTLGFFCTETIISLNICAILSSSNKFQDFLKSLPVSEIIDTKPLSMELTLLSSATFTSSKSSVITPMPDTPPKSDPPPKHDMSDRYLELDESFQTKETIFSMTSVSLSKVKS